MAFDLPHEDQSPGRDVYVIRTDGTAKFRVAPHPAEEMVVGWSPDGKLLLFASDRAGTTDLWSIPIVNGQPGSAPTVLRSSIGQMRASLGLDQSGGLVYQVRTGTTTIATAVLDLDEGTVVSGPATPFENYLSRLRGPDWSKDGTMLAISEETRTRMAMTFRTADGKRLRGDVPLAMHYAATPRWAPDGTIVLQGTDLKGRRGIHRLNPDSGQVEPLVLRDPAAGWDVIAPTMLADGERLMFQRTDYANKRALILRNLRTAEDRVLVEAPRLMPGHTVSPDGRSVAYAIEAPRDAKGGTNTLGVLDIATGTRREVLTIPSPARLGIMSLWTPDGRSILFTRIDSGKPSLWVISASGGSPRPINLELGQTQALKIHPDGKRVAYNTGRNALELWRLDNFLPRLATTSTRR
jgi:Tol biopolymer transport system component